MRWVGRLFAFASGSGKVSAPFSRGVREGGESKCLSLRFSCLLSVMEPVPHLQRDLAWIREMRSAKCVAQVDEVALIRQI